jgi:hypothetical protein
VAYALVLHCHVVCSRGRKHVRYCARPPFTELGFVRTAPQARLSADVATACDLLVQMRGATRPPFVRLTDDLGADALPAWADTPAATTDGHLTALASRRSARLVTLDAGIPGSVLVPA